MPNFFDWLKDGAINMYKALPYVWRDALGIIMGMLGIILAPLLLIGAFDLPFLLLFVPLALLMTFYGIYMTKKYDSEKMYNQRHTHDCNTHS